MTFLFAIVHRAIASLYVFLFFSLKNKARAKTYEPFAHLAERALAAPARHYVNKHAYRDLNTCVGP